MYLYYIVVVFCVLFSCSYLIVSIQDYIVISLELLSHAVIVPEDERLRIHQNLFKVLAVSNINIRTTVLVLYDGEL